MTADPMDRLERAYSPVRIAAAFVSQILRSKCPPDCKIVGVFGPYSDDGRQKIIDVCKMIAQEGQCAVTLDGFFEPSNPNVRQPIDIIMPPIVSFIFRPLQSMYVRILPNAVCRAIINVTVDSRANVIEWDESNNLGKPILNFVVSDMITMIDPNQNCDYLAIRTGWVECTAPKSEFCTGNRFCPFHDLTWVIRQGTMDARTRARLVAVKDVRDLTEVFREFINQP
jgi:hypothetical protein